ncbi:MAG TPA: SDR family oxidoreductase [Telluria sp.]|jgi:NAD(P)-dependent dehydrogenase (short-subunit alcohol dehydrogenase family)
MPTALIIGASRGIGLELVRQYLADGWRVIATARAEADCKRLAGMHAHSYQLDVTSADSIAALGWNLDGEIIDAAFLNAGQFGPRHDGFPTQQEFDSVMHTNVLAAMRLLPVIAPMTVPVRGKLAVLSSIMGSIGQRAGADATLYRASKAALNSVLMDTAIKFGPQGVTCVAFHPGWVKTDMGGEGAEIEVDVSVRGLRATLALAGPAANGTFLNYDGTPIAW